MTIAAIRQQLMTYLAEADDQKVKALYTLLESDLEAQKAFTLSEEHLSILEDRRASYSTGNLKVKSWQEAHATIRSKRKKA